MLLVFQEQFGHGAVAVFFKETPQQNSRKITLSNLSQENRAYTGLSGETIALISSLLFLNIILDCKKVLEVHFGLRYFSRNSRILNIPLIQKHKKNLEKKSEVLLSRHSLFFKMIFIF